MVLRSGSQQGEGQGQGMLLAPDIHGRVAWEFVWQALICRVQGARDIDLCDVQWSGANKAVP